MVQDCLFIYISQLATISGGRSPIHHQGTRLVAGSKASIFVYTDHLFNDNPSSSPKLVKEITGVVLTVCITFFVPNHDLKAATTCDILEKLLF